MIEEILVLSDIADDPVIHQTTYIHLTVGIVPEQGVIAGNRYVGTEISQKLKLQFLVDEIPFHDICFPDGKVNHSEIRASVSHIVDHIHSAALLKMQRQVVPLFKHGCRLVETLRSMGKTCH